MPDVIERLRAANPVPGCPAPSIEDVWRKVEADGGQGAGRRHGGRPARRFPSAGGIVAVVALITSLAVVVLAVALLGHRRVGVSAPRTGTPSVLVSLHAQAGRLLGSTPGLLARIKALRGYPIVINVWASWCTPCRNELGRFASASARYGQRVAFLGADFEDVPRDARSFLARHMVSYPSYETTGKQLRSILSEPLSGVPTTIFVDRAGKVVYVHIGEYGSLAVLKHDIATYLTPRR